MYLRLCENSRIEPDYSFFSSFFKLIVFGDDNIFGARLEGLTLFSDPNIVPLIFSELRITITPAKKDAKCWSFLPIQDISFLKNTPAKDYAGRWVAQLQEDVCKEMISWTRDNSATIQQTLDSCLRFYYFYGSDKFNETIANLRNYMKDNSLVFKNKRINFLNYEQLDDEYNNTRSFEFTDNSEKFIKYIINFIGETPRLKVSYNDTGTFTNEQTNQN
jgi:hypothetical protein